MIWGDAIPHEMNEFTKTQRKSVLHAWKTPQALLKNAMSDSVCFLFAITILDLCIAATADSRIQSSPKAGTRLYVTGLFATIVGKVFQSAEI